MAKTESTAVNKLIELVQTQKPLPPDPSEDLMFSGAPPKKVSAARMTSSVPVHSAGEVAPLPRTRAPQGTQRGVPAVAAPPPSVPPPVPSVRVSTAPPSRTLTIPPLNNAAPPAPPVPAPATNPAELRSTRPSLPPPVRRSSPPIAVSVSVEPADSLIKTTQNLGADLDASIKGQLTTTMMGHQQAPPMRLPPDAVPLPPNATLLGQPALPQQHPIVAPPPPVAPVNQARTTTIPPSMPIAAPFSAPVTPVAPISYPSAQPYMQHLQPDMTSNQAWFDEAGLEAIEHDIGTARVEKVRPSDWKVLLPKLIAPMVVLVIIGVFVGGYFAFDGDGGKKRNEAPVAAAEPAKPAPVAVAAAEPAKPEPVAAEPTSTEPAPAATEAAKAEPTAAEPAKASPEPTKAEPTAAEPAKAEPTKTEPAKAEPTKTEPTKAEPAKTEPAKAAVTPPNLVGTATEPAAPTKAVVMPGRAALVDVRIDTTPAGATVMLVDRGKSTFLGTTPISTAVDPSRKYDLVFTYANKPTQVEHLDPSATKHLTIVLGKPGARAATIKTETPKAARTETPKAVKTETPKAVKTETTRKTEAPKPKKVETTKSDVAKTEPEKAVTEPAIEKKPAGEGTLMISSKPPCEIYVDGAPTGLTTPQRAIKLPAGKHKVTLVNTAEKIKKTLAIEITADQPTKVIQDLMAK
jgi:hypothetical protein